MIASPSVHQTLLEFGHAYGIDKLAFDRQGDASILVDNQTLIFLHFDEAQERLIIETYLGELPDDETETMLHVLMKGNHLSIGTLGGTLALGPDNQIILMRALTHTELNQDIFGLAIQAHAHATQEWSARLGSDHHDDMDSTDTRARKSTLDLPGGMIDPDMIV